MTKLLLGGMFLLAGVFQEPGSIAGKVVLQSSGEGIPEVSITLCPDTGRQVVSGTDGATGLPPRDQVREIRIPSPGEPGQITITSVVADCPNARRTTTDNAGSFIISELTFGSYKIHAQRTGYVGQRESLRGSALEVVSQSVNVSAQRAVPGISFSLIKAGAIAGTVQDANGQPVASVDVQISDKGEPQLLVASRQTDDRGQYRLFGLPPGEFIVVVSVRTVATIKAQPDGKTTVFISNAAEPGATPRYAPTYYPSGLTPADRKIIVLREGEEVSGIDVVLRTLP